MSQIRHSDNSEVIKVLYQTFESQFNCEIGNHLKMFWPSFQSERIQIPSINGEW